MKNYSKYIFSLLFICLSAYVFMNYENVDRDMETIYELKPITVYQLDEKYDKNASDEEKMNDALYFVSNKVSDEVVNFFKENFIKVKENEFKEFFKNSNVYFDENLPIELCQPYSFVDNHYVAFIKQKNNIISYPIVFYESGRLNFQMTTGYAIDDMAVILKDKGVFIRENKKITTKNTVQSELIYKKTLKKHIPKDKIPYNVLKTIEIIKLNKN